MPTIYICIYVCIYIYMYICIYMYIEFIKWKIQLEKKNRLTNK